MKIVFRKIKRACYCSGGNCTTYKGDPRLASQPYRQIPANEDVLEISLGSESYYYCKNHMRVAIDRIDKLLEDAKKDIVAAGY